jgi:hypothetical protein
LMLHFSKDFLQTLIFCALAFDFQWVLAITLPEALEASSFSVSGYRNAAYFVNWRVHMSMIDIIAY